jgi:hypothetical protein
LNALAAPSFSRGSLPRLNKKAQLPIKKKRIALFTVDYANNYNLRLRFVNVKVNIVGKNFSMGYSYISVSHGVGRWHAQDA